MVLRRCRKLLRDEQKALDAMHDVFVQLLRHQDRIEVSSASSLLFRIATNVCLNRIRSERRRPEHEADLLERIAISEDAGERSIARRLLERIFHGEIESTRTIAVLHWVDGMTLEEVANEVGLSVSGVRKRLRTLREHVGALEGA
jgi:RNA polymerase sigma-70 factor (ECF subfamily)